MKPIRMLTMMLAASALSTAAIATTTQPAGGGQGLNNYQPSLVLNQLFATQGIYPGGPYQSLAMIRTFAGNFSAFGAPSAQGQLLSIADNQAVFQVIGTRYGGNGVTNFALPDLSLRSVIGQGQGAGLPAFATGDTTGSAFTTLTEANLPAHSHSLPGGGTTGMTGGGEGFTNYQPSIALTYMISAQGYYPSVNGTNSLTFVGDVAQFAGGSAPNGWLAAEGQILNMADYGTLSAVIGNKFGGDGITTFALPDLRGRDIVEAGTGAGLPTFTFGQSFGSAETVLTLAQLPEHDHALDGGGMTGLAGGAQSFDNYQPGLALHYIIAIDGIFPSSRGGGALPEDYPVMGEIKAFAGDYAPAGWMFADGQQLAISRNQALFSILGTTYGGDGNNVFNLPDLRGRTIIGSQWLAPPGLTGGSASTTLTLSEMPEHAHDLGAGAVPEPASWAMMLGGFGLMGAIMRGQRRRVSVA